MNTETQRKYAQLVLATTPGPHNHMMAELAALHRFEPRYTFRVRLVSRAELEAMLLAPANDMPIAYGGWHDLWKNELDCNPFYTAIGIDWADHSPPGA